MHPERENDMDAHDDDPLAPLRSPGFVLLFVLIILGSLSSSVYDLWRDGQHHRFVAMDLVGLLASLYLAALIGRAARRAWRKVRQRRAGEPHS